MRLIVSALSEGKDSFFNSCIIFHAAWGSVSIVLLSISVKFSLYFLLLYFISFLSNLNYQNGVKNLIKFQTLKPASGRIAVE